MVWTPPPALLRHWWVVGLGLIPWSRLAGGLLGGALRNVQAGRRLDVDFVKQVDNNRSKLERYEALCQELGEEPGTVALA